MDASYVCVWVHSHGVREGCLSLTLWSLISLAVRMMDTDGQDCVCSHTQSHTHTLACAFAWRRWQLPADLCARQNSPSYARQLAAIHWLVLRFTSLCKHVCFCFCSPSGWHSPCWSVGGIALLKDWRSLSSNPQKTSVYYNSKVAAKFAWQSLFSSTNRTAQSSPLARFLHISKQLLHVDLAVIGGMCFSVIYRAPSWCQLTCDKLHNIPKGSFA